MDEYRALKALEQRETELYWAVHEARYPSRPGDDVPEGKVYDSMDALVSERGPSDRELGSVGESLPCIALSGISVPTVSQTVVASLKTAP